MSKIENEYGKYFSDKKITSKKPTIPVVTCISGKELKNPDFSDYFKRVITEPCLFSDAIVHLLSDHEKLMLIEVGVSNNLSVFTRQHNRHFKNTHHRLINTMKSSRKGGNDVSYLFGKIGEMWSRGVEIRWDEIFSTFGRGVEEEKFVDPELEVRLTSIVKKCDENFEIKSVLEKKLTDVFKEEFGIENIGVDENFFEHGITSLQVLHLYNELPGEIKERISVSELYSCNTMRKIGEKFRKVDKYSNFISKRVTDFGKFAIIGMSCNVPGANNVFKFWENLVSKKISVKNFEKSGNDNKNFVPVEYSIDDEKYFDHKFFGIPKITAELSDPQFLKFLELVHHSLEDANIDPDRYKGKIGLFCSVVENTQHYNEFLNAKEVVKSPVIFINNHSSHVFSGFCSYHCGLKGPSFSLNAACSSTLSAIDLAIKHIKCGDCDIAVVGGINLRTFHKKGYLYLENSMLSKDGFTRTFDAEANGVVFGRGGGCVVVTSLELAERSRDQIYAVIRGTAVNNDANFDDRPNIMSPSITGQSLVIEQCLINSGIGSVESIGFIETHGTGTKIGDSTEITALKNVFQKYTEKKNFVRLGAVKQNVSHLDVAAGVVSVIKTVLCLKNRLIPGNPLTVRVNPYLQIENSPFVVSKENVVWEKTDRVPRRAGVSSFVLAGNSSHVILEEFTKPKIPPEIGGEARLFLFSAMSENSLRKISKNFEDFLRNGDLDLSRVAFTLQVGRRQLNTRRFCVAKTKEDFIKRIKAFKMQRIVSKFTMVFAFTGQGSQYQRMTNDLIQRFPYYRRIVNSAFYFVQENFDLDLSVLFDPKNEDVGMINRTKYSQLSLFVVEYALAKLLIDLGITPDMFLGHSLGEYAAACLAGVFSFEDGLRIVHERSKLMDQMEGGVMMSIVESREKVSEYISELNIPLEISLNNSPKNVVVSGNSSQIEKLKNFMDKRGVIGKILKTSHAFHSTSMKPMVSKFVKFLEGIQLNSPTVPFMSNFSGEEIKISEAVNPLYWGRQLENEVKFSQNVESLKKKFRNICFIEIGPGNTLTKLIKQHQLNSKCLVLPTIRHYTNRNVDDVVFFLNFLGTLWTYGVDTVEWGKLYGKKIPRKIRLPLYPFERIKCSLKTKRKMQKFLKYEWVSCVDSKEVPPSEDDKCVIFGSSDPLEFLELIKENKMKEKLLIVVKIYDVLVNEKYSEVFGIAKTLVNEKMGWKVRIINFQDCSLEQEKQVLEDVRKFPYKYESITNVVKGNSYNLRFSRGEMEEGEKIDVKEENCNVISGGLGGIGFELMKFLAEKVGEKYFVLMSRKGEPSESQKTTMEYLRKEKSVKIYVSKTDVTKRTEVRKMYNRIAELKFPQKYSIYHLAMVLEDKNIEEISKEDYGKVVNPKKEGVLNLVETIYGFNVNFALFFSSISSVFGHFLQASYSAGNNFIENYAVRLKNEKKVERVHVLCVPPILDHGIVSKNENLKKFVESNRMGIKAKTLFTMIKSILKGSYSHNVVLIPEFDQELMGRLYPKFEKMLSISSPQKKGKVEIVNKSFQQIQEMITKILREILNLENEEIDVDKNLMEYGADSLTIVQFFKQIPERIVRSSNVEIADLYQYNTIFEISKFLYRKNVTPFYVENIKSVKEAVSKLVMEKLNKSFEEDEIIKELQSNILHTAQIRDEICKRYSIEVDIESFFQLPKIVNYANLIMEKKFPFLETKFLFQEDETSFNEKMGFIFDTKWIQCFERRKDAKLRTIVEKIVEKVEKIL